MGRHVRSVTDDRARLLERRTTKNLGAHSARGLAWTISGQWGGQLFRLVSIVVLARLLTPDDYGLVGMVSAITGFVTTVGTLGISSAMVQRETVTHEQASALFWINVALGVLTMTLVAAAAPLVAAFYSRSELVGITVVLSVTFFLSSVVVQHQALMLRQLNFKAVAMRTLAVTVVTIVTSIVLAAAGAGYWALVLGQVAGSVVAVPIMWASVRWWPSRPGRAAGLKALVSFGGGISTFRVLDYAARNVDNILIGKFLGAGPLGLYTRGYSLLMMPLAQIHGPVASVVSPTMAALWPEPERYKRYYLSALTGLCYVVMPIVVVLSVLANQVVSVLLGPQWLAAAEVFRWLSIAGLLQVVGYTNGWLYSTSGRAWAFARWALISRPVLIAAFVIGLPWGITGVAIAYAAAQVVLTPLGIARAGRGTPVGLRDVLRVTVRPAVITAIAGIAAVVSYPLVKGQGDVTELAVRGGIAVLAGALAILCWPRARRELLGLARSLRPVKPPKVATA